MSFFTVTFLASLQHIIGNSKWTHVFAASRAFCPPPMLSRDLRTCLPYRSRSLSQYSIPVVLSTAPYGDVMYEVKYGQTLWSIAIQYGTTIEQLKPLNNLTVNIVVPG